MTNVRFPTGVRINVDKAHLASDFSTIAAMIAALVSMQGEPMLLDNVSEARKCAV